MCYKLLVFSLLLHMNSCDSYKILLVIPFPMRSHSILGEAFVDILLTAGYEVTYISPTLVDYPVYSHQNFQQIKLESYQLHGVHLKKILNGNERKQCEIFEEMINLTRSAIFNDEVQHLMEDIGQTFDLVIVEKMMNDVYCGFSAVFNCPYIWFSSFDYGYDTMRLIHQMPNPAYATNIMTNNMPPLNFLQRVQELLYVIGMILDKTFYSDPIEEKLFREMFGPASKKRGRVLPPYDEVRYNASLLFTNTHISIRESTEVPLNYKTIGGFHINGHLEPLSDELLNVLDSSKSGVILFSTGSYLQAQQLPLSIKKALLAAFSKLNYTVVWKIDERFEDLPSNVRTFTWIPNQSVLAHPKCVLFITHGGMLSLTESVHYGVPVIGVPIFGDQEVNVKTAVKRGIGVFVPMSLNFANELNKAIEDVLGNPRYKENVMKLSSIYHDRPLSPRLEVLYWIDHVIATQGALHLRSPALMIPWYQKCFLDIAACVLIIIIIIIFIAKRLLTYIIREIRCKPFCVMYNNSKKSN